MKHTTISSESPMQLDFVIAVFGRMQTFSKDEQGHSSLKNIHA